MRRRHGHQALDSSEGYGAALGRPHEAAADAILAVVLCRRGEDAVGAETLRGHRHAVCGVRMSRLQSEEPAAGTSQHKVVSLSVSESMQPVAQEDELTYFHLRPAIY